MGTWALPQYGSQMKMASVGPCMSVAFHDHQHAGHSGHALGSISLAHLLIFGAGCAGPGTLFRLGAQLQGGCLRRSQRTAAVWPSAVAPRDWGLGPSQFPETLARAVGLLPEVLTQKTVLLGTRAALAGTSKDPFSTP